MSCDCPRCKNATGKCLWRVIDDLELERDRYRAALERIATLDYRGNRSTESSMMAYHALHNEA